MLEYQRKTETQSHLKLDRLSLTKPKQIYTTQSKLLLREKRTTSNIKTSSLKKKQVSQKVISQPKTDLKRKLLVYRKDGKFYIDHSAAYALNLTNIRSIMLENPHLKEIGLETLYRLQNSENIEIEYSQLDKDKQIMKEDGNLQKRLEELENGEYGIGLHGIDKGNEEERESKGISISNEGLKLNNNSRTILSTAISLGTNKKSENLVEEIEDYRFGNGGKTTIVIATPICIQNKDKEKIFLGFPEENHGISGQQYEEHCILDRICAQMQRIPPEFILGYYSEDEKGKGTFIENSKHYSNIGEEEKEELYNEMYSNLDDVSKSINVLISRGEHEKLSQMKEIMQQRQMSTYMVDNALTLVQKYKEKGKLQGTKDMQKTELRDTKEDLEKKPKIRKILLDACKETKTSDLREARQILAEGIRTQEKEEEKYESRN